jgi:hypothetical protein
MAEFNTIDGRVLGLFLDVSWRLDAKGVRVLDTVKSQLIDFLRETMDGEDLFYLYHPDLIEPVETIGKMVSAVANYETDGWLVNVFYALLQTFLVVSVEDEDYERAILFITDRIQGDAAIRKLLQLEKRDQSNCKFILVGVGSHYRQKALKDVAKDNPAVVFHHIDDPNDLTDALLERRSDS